MRKFHFIGIGFFLCGLLLGIARAETFQLNDGQTVSGEVIAASANESGLQLRIEEGKYERIPWAKFSQEDLKKLSQNPKIEALVEPFIEVSQEEKIKRTEVPIKEVPRLKRPEAQSLLGAMFSSSVGLTVLFLLYAANLYAGYEVSIFRSQPAALVCGVSAVLPVIGPIIFLSMPTKKLKSEDELEAEAAAAALPTSTFAMPVAEAAPEEPQAGGGGLRLSRAEPGAAAGIPETQIFQRGAFTFNRRFFETKFSGFFGVVRREAEKDLVLVIKSARGTYAGERVTRITGNDLHLQIQRGGASEEVMIPFSDVQEVQLKHVKA